MGGEINPEEAEKFLEEQDKKYGINQSSTKLEEPKSLGQVKTFDDLSGANESTWKLLSFDTLPSLGLFYPDGAELLIRSAKTKEIRHWSTIDEYDPLSIREKINFILLSCTKFKIKGSPRALNHNDFLEVDKYHIIFRIYELTFPNQENKLFAQIKCDNDGIVNRTQVSSKNLKGFSIPYDLQKWYSEKERCFVIPSSKLNETLKIYMPTIGMASKFRQKRADEINNSVNIDDVFYIQGPYLLTDWRRVDNEMLSELKYSSSNWSEDKFLIIYKIIDLLEKSGVNKAVSVCEKCKTQTESHIFLGGSFTIKDIFIISTGLDELI